MNYKQIEGYDYYIYEDGRVQNITTREFVKTFYSDTGFLYCWLLKEGRKKPFFIHRLVAYYFLPNFNHYSAIIHRDGDKTNNNVYNLKWEKGNPEQTLSVQSAISYKNQKEEERKRREQEKEEEKKRREEERKRREQEKEEERKRREQEKEEERKRREQEKIEKKLKEIPDLLGEVWRGVPNFPQYQVSSKGRVKNVQAQRLLSIAHANAVRSYPAVVLVTFDKEKGTSISKNFALPILIYSAFNGKEYDSYTQKDSEMTVVHIDGDKFNNVLENLKEIPNEIELIDSYYKKSSTKRSKILAFSQETGECLGEFSSQHEAARAFGLNSIDISKNLRGLDQSVHGYFFEYK